MVFAVDVKAFIWTSPRCVWELLVRVTSLTLTLSYLCVPFIVGLSQLSHLALLTTTQESSQAQTQTHNLFTPLQCPLTNDDLRPGGVDLRLVHCEAEINVAFDVSPAALVMEASSVRQAAGLNELLVPSPHSKKVPGSNPGQTNGDQPFRFFGGVQTDSCLV